MWATSPTSMSSPRLVGKAKCLQCTTNRPPLTDHKLSWSSEESAQYSPLAKRSSHWEEPTWRPRRLGWPGCHRYLELWSCLPVPIHIVSSVLTCAGMQELNWGRRLFKCSGVFGTVASPPKSWRKTWSWLQKQALEATNLNGRPILHLDHCPVPLVVFLRWDVHCTVQALLEGKSCSKNLLWPTYCKVF